MPAWINAALVTAALALAFWWLETKVAAVLTELRAVRENLEKLVASVTVESEDDGAE